MQALAGVRVLAVGLDDELVLGCQALERDARVGEDVGGLERAAVQRDAVHLAGDEVDERRRALGGGERDDRARGEHLVAAGEVELHVVGVRIDDGAPLLRFDAGEVLSWHWRSPGDEGRIDADDAGGADGDGLDGDDDNHISLVTRYRASRPIGQVGG
ncbi:hypothetical protein QE414_002069 [Microbacterium sp. SORGH_AS 344]|nr:hypothetical protein [Microbacterium sp. SORGH_AS_0344]